jgi:hypothetical protein
VLVVLHKILSGPALAVVGSKSALIVTKSLFERHKGLEMVHFKITDNPGTNPEINVVGEVGFIIVAFPETIVHKPVPTLGVLAASVAVVVPHTS